MSEFCATIAGMGMVSCLGIGAETAYQQAIAGVCGVRPLTRFPADAYEQRSGGQLAAADEATLSERYDEDDLTFSMLCHCVDEALGEHKTEAVDDSLALVTATNFGVMDMLEWCWHERIDTGELDGDTFASHHQLLSRIAAYAGAGGPRVQLSVSCASGAAALEQGLTFLQQERAQSVLILGYDILSEFCWTGLSNLRTITTDRLRPFDVRRQGTVFSEGAAAVWLRRLPADAVGDKTLCLAAAATNNNAFHLTAPAKEAEGSRRVMAEALTRAGMTASDVDFVSAHATGTVANDSTESAALRNLMGERVAELPVAAFKSAVGHMLGAAGLAEVILACQSLVHGAIPPVVNLETQDEACGVKPIRDVLRSDGLNVSLTNSAGIGGNNAATVVSRGSAPFVKPSNEHITVLSAGWVLPGTVGGGAPSDIPANSGKNADLANFVVKPYIRSVKGYLDPAAAYGLAAARLCLSPDLEGEPEVPTGNVGIVAVTEFGANRSAYRFFQQMVEKGARAASPLIFPHGYPNTVANLVAIEYGFAGPHMVYSQSTDVDEALWFAQTQLQLGRVDEMWVLCYEACAAEAVPDTVKVLDGALCLRLALASSEACILQPASGARKAFSMAGSVAAALKRFMDD